jgi:hypothetical protein
VQPLLDQVERLQWIVKNDEDLKRLFRDVKEYCNKTLKDPKEMKDDKHFDDGKQLIDRIFNRAKLDAQKDSELRRCLEECVRELRIHLKGIKEDETFVHLGDDFKNLGKQIFFTPTGEPSLKPLVQLVKEIKTVYLPTLQNEVQALKFPRLEGYTEKAEFMVEGLTLNPIDILPDSFHLSITYDMDAHIKSMDRNIIDAVISLELRDIKQDLSDVKFEVKMKSGRYHDKGIANILLDGFTMSIQWRAEYDGNKWRFTVSKTTSSARKFKIHVKSDRHQILDSMGLAFFGGIVKRKILGAIKDSLAVKGQEISDRLALLANQELEKKRAEDTIEKVEAHKPITAAEKEK